jgi:hypothetical protein
MTKRDFNLLARVLLSTKPDPKGGTIGERRVWARTVRAMAAELQSAHETFEIATFYAACQYAGEGL